MGNSYTITKTDIALINDGVQHISLYKKILEKNHIYFASNIKADTYIDIPVKLFDLCHFNILDNFLRKIKFRERCDMIGKFLDDIFERAIFNRAQKVYIRNNCNIFMDKIPHHKYSTTILANYLKIYGSYPRIPILQLTGILYDHGLLTPGFFKKWNFKNMYKNYYATGFIHKLLKDKLITEDMVEEKDLPTEGTF